MLYQINTRVWLGERSQTLGRPATLDDVTTDDLESIRELGFSAIWWLGIWQTGPNAQRLARTHPGLLGDYAHVLPEFTLDDVAGSPFAIAAYTVHADFGGDASLARLRCRMREAGLDLWLDFVPNHVGLDHPWLATQPQYFVSGAAEDVAQAPDNFLPLESVGRASRYVAHGRDPYFAGWTDTLQLNYRDAALRQAMLAELHSVASRCDGVRCDMAMLLLPQVFLRTWGDLALPADGSPPVDDSFWEWAIPQVKAAHPGFRLMAEVYWDLECELLLQGFDFAYDKLLYDRLHYGDLAGIRSHLQADLTYQSRLVRFLENHDEPRAATTFPGPQHKAAAVLCWCVPGLAFLHEGQLEGRRAKLPIQLARRPVEPVQHDLKEFYTRLLPLVADPLIAHGQWSLLESRPAWDGNPSHAALFALRWCYLGCEWLVTVNYAPHYSQGYITAPLGLEPPLPAATEVDLIDQLSPTRYRRSIEELATRGLYLDLPPWGVHLFEIDRRV
jgi:hypothetical protein